MPTQIRHDLHTVDVDLLPYVYERNAIITLQSRERLVRCNVYRPKSTEQGEKVVVFVTYGLYGKDTFCGEYLLAQSVVSSPRQPNYEQGFMNTKFFGVRIITRCLLI
jgi:hypothetical protein